MYSSESSCPNSLYFNHVYLIRKTINFPFIFFAHSYILNIDIKLIILYVYIKHQVSRVTYMYVHVCHCQSNSTNTTQILNQWTSWRHSLCYYYLRKQFSHIYESILAAPSSPLSEMVDEYIKVSERCHGTLWQCFRDEYSLLPVNCKACWDHPNTLTCRTQDIFRTAGKVGEIVK